MKIILKDIGKFHELLLRKGFTRHELVRQAGISEVFAQQISNGDRNPGAKVARRICESLEVEFDDIFLSLMLAVASKLIKMRRLDKALSDYLIVKKLMSSIF